MSLKLVFEKQTSILLGSFNFLSYSSMLKYIYLCVCVSAASFSSCPQSCPALGSFPMSWLFASGGQSTGASASASVRQLSFVQLFGIPWTAACQASQSITDSQSLLKFMSIKSVMPSNYLILCLPLLFLPSAFPSIGSFPRLIGSFPKSHFFASGGQSICFSIY